MMRIQLMRKHAALAASISLVLLASTAFASDQNGRGAAKTDSSPHKQMQMGDSAGGKMGGGRMDRDMRLMMKKMHTRMHGDSDGHRMGGDGMGGGMMGGDDPAYDANGDGTTSVEELRDALQAELTKYDSDSNGFLDIGEFEELHSARIRSQMVDRFQALDEDGDGELTKEEMTAPADKMQRRMDRQAKSRAMPYAGRGHATLRRRRQLIDSRSP